MTTLFRARWLAPALLAAPTLAAAAPAEGVISYPPAFFAAQQPGNAREMLERVPGLSLDFGNGSRGFEGAAGNVLIDGRRPASKTDYLGDILARIPAGKVARIDVIRGGAPGIDMQGKAVIANVILKAGGGVRGQVTTRTSHFSDGRTIGGLDVQASGGSGERKWEVSALRAKGVDGVSGDGPGTTTFTDSRPPLRTFIDTEGDGHFQQGTGAYELPLAGGKLRVNARLYIDKFKFEEDATDLANGAVQSTDQLILTDERELGGAFNRSLSPRTTMEAVGLYQTNHGELSSDFVAGGGAQRFDLDRRTRETIARLVLKHAWRETLSLEAGAETARNRLESLSEFRIGGAAIPLPAAEVTVTETRNELFGKVSWRPAAAWSLDGAVRYEHSAVASRGDVRLAKTLRYMKPRLAITWSPDPANQVRVRFEREVGQLDFDDFVAQADLNTVTGVTAGNPDLEPERAWVAEAAFERRFWGRGALVVTARHSEVQGVVDRGPVFTSGGIFDRPSNIGDGRRELVKADLTLPLDQLGLKGGLLKSYVVRRWSRVDDPTTGGARRISRERPVEWNTQLSQDLPNLHLTWGVYVEGGYQQVYHRFNAVDAVKLEPYLMVFLEWKPRADFSLRAEVDNITQRGYRRTTITYPGPRGTVGASGVVDRDTHSGRSVYLRLRKTFGG